MGCAAFIVRFILYALIVGAATAVATGEWNALALDQAGTASVSLGDVRAQAVPYIGLAPLGAAIVGALSPAIGTFFIWYVVGALVTAPWALARALGV
jgi:hypothetical protein